MSAIEAYERYLSASPTPSSEALHGTATVGVLENSAFAKKKSLFLMIGPPRVKP